MIRYYAYYSYGGYKDMYVGDQSAGIERRYYLPLVLNGLDSDKSKLNEPQITVYDASNADQYPSALGALAGTGGFKIFYSSNYKGMSVLAIRDINGTERDENGRAIPFVLLMAADRSDSRTLAAAAAWALMHERGIDSFFGSLFSYDPNLNGLCFECGKLTSWLASISDGSTSVTTADRGSIDLLSAGTFITLTIKNDPSALLSRLSIDNSMAVIEPADRVLPVDDKALTENRRKAWDEYHTALTRRRRMMIYSGVGIFALAALVAFILSSTCSGPAN